MATEGRHGIEFKQAYRSVTMQSCHLIRHTCARISLLLLVFTLSIGGCATHISTLRPTPSHSAKTPQNSFLFNKEGTALGLASQTTLLPGIYTPLGQNEQGIWYMGAGENVQVFYTEKKRSDGKRLLSRYTGGVLVPHKPENAPTIFIMASTEKMTLVFDPPGVETELSRSGNDTAGLLQSQAAANAGAHPAGAALGGAIADTVLAYDATGLRLLPWTAAAPGLAAWLEGR